MAMFMMMIPQLVNKLFNIKISEEYYQKTKNDIKVLWQDLKKWGSAIKK